MYQLDTKGDFAIYTDDSLGIQFSILKGLCAGLKQTSQIPAIEDEKVLEAVFSHPISGIRLSEMARQRNSKTACILISDATRAVPTGRLAKFVVDELTAGGVPLSGITFFVAIGVHRPATEGEMKLFLGSLYGKVKVENHRPFDPENIISLGKTSSGTPIEVNKGAYACDLHIQIGKVEPHEFAGFSGGRKSVLPGISSEETIIVNHRPEMILHPKAAIGVLDGNPVHEDMVEAAKKFRIDFAVNCIVNNELHLAAAFAGGLEESHMAAIDFVRQSLSVSISKPDIIVTTPGQPLDIDFYQTVKALIALTEILDETITVVLYCGCGEGVNSPDMLRAFRSSDDLNEVIKFTTENYQIQMDHVLLLSKFLKKNVKIVVCCPNVSDQEIRDMFMIPCCDPAKVMDTAFHVGGKRDPKVLFYPRPQTGLPVLEK